MSVRIGFVLLTHAKPAQIHRLTDRLTRMFDKPPIVARHDFSQCPLDTSQFPDNVSFVVPSLKTEWGAFSVVEGAVKAIRQLYGSSDAPDWFALLSGSDYPIKPAAQIRQDLAKSHFDAYIHCELIQPGCFERDWQRLCYDRYYTTSDGHLPFSDDFRCYAGEFWFTANRHASQYIRDFYETQPALASHYERAENSEESYFQCILANARCFNINNDPLRYIDWSDDNSAHPKTLGIDDLKKILSSPAHFARKFDIDYDPGVLDALDAVILP